MCTFMWTCTHVCHIVVLVRGTNHSRGQDMLVIHRVYAARNTRGVVYSNNGQRCASLIPAGCRMANYIRQQIKGDEFDVNPHDVRDDRPLRITVGTNGCMVRAPHDSDFHKVIYSLGGRWNTWHKAYGSLPLRLERSIRDAMIACYGTDGDT